MDVPKVAVFVLKNASRRPLSTKFILVSGNEKGRQKRSNGHHAFSACAATSPTRYVLLRYRNYRGFRRASKGGGGTGGFQGSFRGASRGASEGFPEGFGNVKKGQTVTTPLAHVPPPPPPGMFFCDTEIIGVSGGLPRGGGVRGASKEASGGLQGGPLRDFRRVSVTSKKVKRSLRL